MNEGNVKKLTIILSLTFYIFSLTQTVLIVLSTARVP